MEDAPLQRVAGANTEHCRCRGATFQLRVSVPHIIICRTVPSLGHVYYRNTTVDLFTHTNICFSVVPIGHARNSAASEG